MCITLLFCESCWPAFQNKPLRYYGEGTEMREVQSIFKKFFDPAGKKENIFFCCCFPYLYNAPA
jgi:hypothetical protein